jgi:hypothetical protein
VGGDEQDPEERGNDAERHLVDLHVSAGPLEPGRGQGEVVERRSVVLRGVVGVVSLLQEGAELVGMDGLVRVHRPPVEGGETQGRAHEDRHQEDQRPR